MTKVQLLKDIEFPDGKVLPAGSYINVSDESVYDFPSAKLDLKTGEKITERFLDSHDIRAGDQAFDANGEVVTVIKTFETAKQAEEAYMAMESTVYLPGYEPKDLSALVTDGTTLSMTTLDELSTHKPLGDNIDILDNVPVGDRLGTVLAIYNGAITNVKPDWVLADKRSDFIEKAMLVELHDGSYKVLVTQLANRL